MVNDPMIEVVSQASSIALDTCAFIYFIEDNTTYASLLEPVMQAIDNGTKSGITSVLTLLEVLVKPLAENRTEIAEAYRNTLLSSNIQTILIDDAVAHEAAKIRANYKFKVPDSIQLAVAKLNNAEVFITNDDQLRKFTDLKVIILKDYVN